MITNWLFDTAQNIIGWFLSFFPSDVEPPEWLVGLSSLLGQVLAGAAGLGVWVPWIPIITVVSGTVILWSVGLTVKFTRWVVGLFPTMGSG